MKGNNSRLRLLWLTYSISLLALAAPGSTPSYGQVAQSAQTSQRTFAETGKSVKGRFLEYWERNGGLPQQGYPISEEMQERSDTDGKTYTVQYFERAVFELHPENQAPNDVLLSLLGAFLYNQKYPGGAPNQTANGQPNARLFQETGKRVGGVFLEYWQQNGGLAQQGLPISDEFVEVSRLDGKSYTVQYFERAVFEMHPENQPPYNVLLSQLGTFRYQAKYLQSVTPGTAPPTAVSPTVTPPPTSSSREIPQPPEYAEVRAKFETMTPEQWKAAGYTFTDPCDPGIGVRVWHPELWEAQFDSGVLDPHNPPVLFANGTGQRIIGLQWAVNYNTTPPPVLFGQPFFVRYPNGEPRYALFSWFKPNGHVLFAQGDIPDPCRR